VLELIERRVAALHHNGGERELGESLHLEGERSVREHGGEVLQALALDGGEHGPVGCLDLSGTQTHPSCCLGVFVDQSAESVAAVDLVRRARADEA
jgi:hypothetical protein